MATLNFTGRMDIDRSRVQLRIREDDGKILLDVLSINLDGLDLPPNARVTVEAYRQTTKERVDCGTAGSVEMPQAVHLSAFDVSEHIQLRVRVVGADGPTHGKILAVADHLRGAAERDDESEPLLKLQRTDLGDLVWRFGIDGDHPILYVNKYLQDHDGIVNSPYFKALILPEFFRQVCIWIAGNLEDTPEPESTLAHWLLYLESIGIDLGDLDDLEPAGEGNSEIISEWAARAASTFASEIHSLLLLNGTDHIGEDGNE